MRVDVTQAEFDTIIAALRLYAGHLSNRRAVSTAEVEDIATNSGLHPAPTSDGVYELGDKLLGLEG